MAETKEKREPAGKKKRGRGCAAVIVLLLLVIAAAWIFLGLGDQVMAFLPFGGGKGETRTTQTSDSRKYQKEMEQLAETGTIQIQEDDYGLLTLTVPVKIPDYSAYFSDFWEEASIEVKDEKEFEKKLFRMTADAVKAEPPAESQLVTRQIVVELSMIDGSKGKDDWSQADLEELARREAFEEEMREFAMELVGSYLGYTTDWDGYGTVKEAADHEE